MRRRAGVWLRRYLPAELVSLACALLAASIASGLTNQSGTTTALAAAWAETLAYYATMFVRELTSTRGGVMLVLRDLGLEFGVAEALDSLLLRPALMYAAGQILSDLRAGVLVGKLAADVVFYFPTIVAYELRRKYIRGPGDGSVQTRPGSDGSVRTTP